ncbi:peroxisomal membrane protein 11-3-like [Phalaenopsis equestris]|uniref:peroxisomal membrane protein 11-3-like n=1 Tax=Phalaenopsis equestris TaxID=78828 RepID=UPI0009E21C03|nr:peroxisomal membrane protein 11-3-like [Phalaenopsis equestris]
MEAEMKPSQKSEPLLSPNSCNDGRDFLLHLEAYLARRDGVDKLLKIARYAAKIAIASSLPSQTLTPRLKSFESSVGLSRKAFRLGKFVQDVNALRDAAGRPTSYVDFLLSAAAYGGEGVYYFLEQVVWLSKVGILSPELARSCQTVSAWAELIGYVGSITLKVKEVRKIRSTIESRRRIAEYRDGDDVEISKLRHKLLLKQLSLVQDLADGLMVFGDVRDGKGFLTDPLLMASAGMLSALISTHKNWTSC